MVLKLHLGSLNIVYGTEGSINIDAGAQRWPRVWVILSTGIGLRDSRIGHRPGETILRDLSDTFLLNVKLYELLRQEVLLVSFLPSFAFWNMYLTICYRMKTILLLIPILKFIIGPQS